MDLPESCIDHGGMRHPTRDGYRGSHARDLVAALRAAGYPHDDLPASICERAWEVYTSKRRVIAHIQCVAGDDRPPGYSGVPLDKPKWWERAYDLKAQAAEVPEITVDFVRPTVSEHGDDLGCRYFDEAQQQWCKCSSSSALRQIMQVLGVKRVEAECIFGLLERRRWTLVFNPFGPIEDGRRWNVDAPQLRFAPVPGPHPHWDLILAHVGQELDGVLPGEEWGIANGIRTGGDYMKALLASIIRHPFEQTPFVFAWGPENSGKSILWEGFSKLVTKGVVLADRALTSHNDFNGEIANAIVCVVEEKDISKTAGALAKIKAAVTGQTTSVRRMRMDAYQIPNCTHWFQFANSLDNCPIGWGDTRIVALHVTPPAREIPKKELLAALEAEGPAITHALLTLPLPAIEGRLNLPPLATPSKHRAMSSSIPPLVTSIVDLATESGKWEGTAVELQSELTVSVPRDRRPIQRMVEEHARYLDSVRVVVEFPEGRTKQGTPIRISRK